MYCPSKARCFYCHCLFSECFKCTIQLQGVCSSSCAYPLQCSYDRPEHLPNSGSMSLGKRFALSLQLCGGWRRCVGFCPECSPPVSFFHCATQQAVVARLPASVAQSVDMARSALQNGLFQSEKRPVLLAKTGQITTRWQPGSLHKQPLRHENMVKIDSCN